MRRVAAAALLAVGFALAVSGCGVQSTGVNVAQTEPFSTAAPNSSMSASPLAQRYPVRLFLFPAAAGSPREVTRYVSAQPKSAIDLAYILRNQPQEDEDGYINKVPADLTLEQTSNAHEYRITSTSPVPPAALYQLVCTLDQYWQDRSDGHTASTQFLYPASFPNGWQDCLNLLPDTPPTKLVTSKPSVPTETSAFGSTGN
jgi:hypothetical protein